MKKIVKLFTVLSVFLLTQWTLQAQPPHQGPRFHRGPALEQLEEELNITEEQKTKLKAAHEAQMAKMEALKEQEFESREERFEAMKALRDEERTAVNNILTAEQQEKLAALKAEKEKERAEQREERKEKHEAMRAEMKAYHATEVLPVMKEQRTKLEAKISAEDKVTIAGLRSKMEAGKAAWEGKEPGERWKRPELTEEQKAAFKAERETIKALVEKYDADITALLGEIKTEREEWKEDMREIGGKYAPERPDFRGERKKERPAGEQKAKVERERKADRPERGRGDHARRGDRHEGMGKAAFLLLDPNVATTQNVTGKADFAQIRVFPNPSAGRNTVNYKLTEAGYYRVELRDKNGQVLQELSNEYRQSGDYQDEVDMSQFPSGTYYLSITGAEGVISEKIVKQ
jgi:Spy/CpxP family protein refolding chaperone